MGVDPITAGLGAVSVVGGLYGQHQARKAARAGQRAIAAAPGKALDYTQQVLDRFGAPAFGDAQFYGVGPEGYQAKSQAIYQQQMSLLQPQLEDEKRAIEQRMLAQGMPSSLVTEALRSVEGKYSLAAQQAALQGTLAGVDLQSQEAARHTAFSQAESAKQYQESAYAPNLAAGLVGPFMGAGQASAQVGMTGQQQQQQALAGIGSGLGSLYGNYMNYNLGQKYIDTLAGNRLPSDYAFSNLVNLPK